MNLALSRGECLTGHINLFSVHYVQLAGDLLAFVFEYVTCRDLGVGWIFQAGVRDFYVVENFQNGSRPYPFSGY